MKARFVYTTIFAIFVIVLYGCGLNGEHRRKSSSSQEYAYFVEFDSADVDLGATNKECRMVSHTFILKNISDSDICISYVSGGCHCVKAEYTKYPIGPTGNGFVTMHYTFENQTGLFDKNVLILLNNGKYYTMVRIKGRIQ